MREIIKISGHCPEMVRGGRFPLEEILSVLHLRLLKGKPEPDTSCGIVKGIRHAFWRRDKYSLETTGENVDLQFLSREGGIVYLQLPSGYGFGRELMESEPCASVED